MLPCTNDFLRFDVPPIFFNSGFSRKNNNTLSQNEVDCRATPSCFCLSWGVPGLNQIRFIPPGLFVFPALDSSYSLNFVIVSSKRGARQTRVRHEKLDFLIRPPKRAHRARAASPPITIWQFSYIIIIIVDHRSSLWIVRKIEIERTTTFSWTCCESAKNAFYSRTDTNTLILLTK